MAICVDDIVIASQSETWIAEMKINLMQEFEMKDLGKIRHCLGFEFTHAADKIFMTQTIQILQILKRFGMEDSRPVGTPIDSGAKLLKPENPSREEMEMYPFRELIGSLMYLAVGTQPDIAYAISSLSQFSTCYAKDHWIALTPDLHSFWEEDLSVGKQRSNVRLRSLARKRNTWLSRKQPKKPFT